MMIDIQLVVPAFTCRVYLQDNIFGVTVPTTVKEMPNTKWEKPCTHTKSRPNQTVEVTP